MQRPIFDRAERAPLAREGVAHVLLLLEALRAGDRPSPHDGIVRERRAIADLDEHRREARPEVVHGGVRRPVLAKLAQRHRPDEIALRREDVVEDRRAQPDEKAQRPLLVTAGGAVPRLFEHD